MLGLVRVDFTPWEHARRAFRPRVFYHTSDHGTRVVAISTPLQVGAAAAGLALVLLAGLSMIGAFQYRDLAATRTDALSAVSADYRALLERLEVLSDHLDTVGTVAAEAPGAMLRNLLRDELTRGHAGFPEPGSQDTALAALSGELLPRSVADGLILTEAHGRLLQRLEEAEQETKRLAAREQALSIELAEAQDRIAALENARLDDARSIEAMTLSTADLERRLADAERRSQAAASDLAAARLLFARERERYEAVKLERQSLHAETVRLEGEIASYRNAQASWLLALGARTQHSISLVERAVAMTGINVDALISRARKELRSAAGGPFIAVSVPEAGTLPDGVNEIATDVGARVERWEALKRVVQAMPLAAPLDQFLIGSGFGPRTDPFNGRRATHTGLDFNAPLKTPVLGTAPGRVVFAGWHREYGRLVEIDHGFGIRTRYAHLAAISVKKGDKVALRAKIGLLGSSGRSTGPHLHYEILVDGKSVDPFKFLEAARHVLKG